MKNLPAIAGDMDLIPGSKGSPGGGNGYPLQYACLGNLMDRGAWWATFHGVTESDMTEATNTSPYGIIKCSRLVLYFLCPGSRTSYFPKDLHFMTFGSFNDISKPRSSIAL